MSLFWFISAVYLSPQNTTHILCPSPWRSRDRRVKSAFSSMVCTRFSVNCFYFFIAVQVQTPTVTGSGGVTSLTVNDGSSVNVTCSTTSTLTLTASYTWYGTGGVILAGQNTAQYSLSAASLANSGDLKCSVTYNAVESALSSAFALSGERMGFSFFSLSFFFSFFLLLFCCCFVVVLFSLLPCSEKGLILKRTKG